MAIGKGVVLHMGMSKGGLLQQCQESRWSLQKANSSGSCR